MRLLPFFASLLILGATTGVYASSALLPSSDGSDSKGANLGLGTTTQGAVPPATSLQATKPAEVEESAASGDNAASRVSTRNVPATAAPQNVSPALLEQLKQMQESQGDGAGVLELVTPKAPKVFDITPGGTLAKGADPEKAMLERLKAAGVKPMSTTASPRISPEIQKKLDEIRAAQADRRPATKITNDFLFPEFSAKTISSFPNALSIAVGSNYVWGVSDVRMISTLLGYKASQIPSNCQLHLVGVLRTDKGSYPLAILGGQRKSVRYDGAISDVMLTPRAVCKAPDKLPRAGGTVLKVGDKLGVPLTSQINCQAPAQEASALEIAYVGDGKTQCAYR